MPACAAGFDADGAFSLVPASASSSASSSFKRTPSALTQLCAISLSDDAPFAPDANAHDLAAGGPRRGVARSEDVMATEPSERRRADERQAEIDEISQHIDPRRRRHLESAGLGHLFG